ncbi:MAG: diacylglycerol/lipid kinase family protein [Ktedonobacteraceae bacterium]
MHCKDTCLIVDLREGQDLAEISNMIAVLSAAGWKTDIALKVYSGEALKLARKAADQGYDAIIAYGGDGTLNQVINGVMNVGSKSIVGVIPGGTANEWAGEISVPEDHVKAALTLVNSDVRKVDLGHVSVAGLSLPDAAQTQGNAPAKDTAKGKESKKKKKLSAGTRPYFLLMAGLGVDAAVIAKTSKSLKQHMGRLAFDAAAVKELPRQQPFAVEIQATDKNGNTERWQGEALQIFIANTRRYANMVEVTSDAYLDDGILDVCVITSGNPLKTMEQLTSLLLRHKPDATTSTFLHGAQISIRVPASIRLQLDGNAVDLQDYLDKSEQEALQQVPDPHEVMVNYQFKAEPHALRMAIPRTYDDALFQHRRVAEQPEAQHNGAQVQGTQAPRPPSEAQIEALTRDGYKVTMLGSAADPARPHTYIIAGNMHKQDNDETKPVAVRVNGKAATIKRSGEYLSPTSFEQLEEGTDIVVTGKKNKRGVIRATHVIV